MWVTGLLHIVRVGTIPAMWYRAWLALCDLVVLTTRPVPFMVPCLILSHAHVTYTTSFCCAHFEQRQRDPMKLVMFKGGEERGHAMQCELLSQDHTPGLRPSPLGPLVLCAFRTKAL